MTTVRKEPPKTTMEVLEVQTINNFLEVQAVSKYDNTIQVTAWLRGTDLSDPRSYTPLNPREHKGIGVRIPREDLPAVIEFLQDQLAPKPKFPTAVGSVVWAKTPGKGHRSDGPGGKGYPFYLAREGWTSAKGNYRYSLHELELVSVVFDASNPGYDDA